MALLLLPARNLAREVAALGKLKHEEEAAFFIEGIAVGDDVVVGERGQDAHLVQRAVLVLASHAVQADPLESIDSIIGQAPNFKNGRICPLPDLPQDLEVFNCRV